MTIVDDADDENSSVPEVITEYRFADENDDPICFSALPLQYNDDDGIADDSVKEVFLHGEFDDGLQKIYKRVVAWNVEFVEDEVELSVLSKDGNWLKIVKPRKNYQLGFRRIYVSLESLSYLKRNPSSPENRFWEHLKRRFSHFEASPCKDDLMFQQDFIRSIVERNKALSKAELFVKLRGRSLTKKSSTLNGDEGSSNKDDITSPKVNNDGDNGGEDDDHYNDAGSDDGDDDDRPELDDGYDHVCVICDNGGDLLCCEGECLRSFHATKGSGADSQCKTLGYTRAQVKAIQNFICPNCLQKKHQCFVCGKLGNSDKESGPEVFRCMSATCGHFYHPACVAKLLNPDNESEAAKLEKDILAGGSFMCPVHRCTVCNGLEDKKVEELQFAICRRCPKTYHRKCLPSKIALDESDGEEGAQRAWDGLIPDRILIYCLKHKIDSDLGTPKRNHIVFPEMVDKKTVASAESTKKKAQVKRKAENKKAEEPKTKKKTQVKRIEENKEDEEEQQKLKKKAQVKRKAENQEDKEELKTKKESQVKRKAEVSPYEKRKPNKLSWPSEERENLGITKKPLQQSKTQQLSSSFRRIIKESTGIDLNKDEDKLEQETTYVNMLEDETSDVVPSIERKSINKKQIKSTEEDVGKRDKHKGDNSTLHLGEKEGQTLSSVGSKKKALEIRKAEILSIKRKRPKDSMMLDEEIEDHAASALSPRHSKGLKDSISSLKKPSFKDEDAMFSAPESWMGTSMDGNAAPTKESNIPNNLIDEEARKRILFFVKKSRSLSMRNQSSRVYRRPVKSITSSIVQGRVENYVRAIRAAVQIFKNGGNINDAKAVCRPEIVNQIIIWKETLRTYLGPLLHGSEDSSYGRDTKDISELEGLVERLHWYMENDDTIIDVCCGVKSFNNLMKKRLELTGKNCSFKSFDIFAPKNDANFQKRDWMAVQPKELQLGPQLVIRLVLSRGVNAAHAHRLIGKALACKPKLLVLISPKFLERLGVRPEGYDLIWEDEQKPVSQANSQRSPVKPFSLYLWSRPDCSAKIWNIAMERGHTSDKPIKRNSEDKDLNGLEAEDYENRLQNPVEYDSAHENTERERREMKPNSRLQNPEIDEKVKISPYHSLQVWDEASPKNNKSQGETTMKYHWSCLYGLDDQPEPGTSSGPVVASPRPVTPKPTNRDTSPGERIRMTYQWDDLYGQEEREYRRSSEFRPSLDLQHHHMMIPGPSDRRPLISPRRMMDSPRERETQNWVSGERPYPGPFQSELGRRGSPLLSPFYAIDDGLPVGLPGGPGYHASNFERARYIDPEAEHARLMYERRMWEMSERARSPIELRRSGSGPPRGRHRGMFDADYHPYL